VKAAYLNSAWSWREQAKSAWLAGHYDLATFAHYQAQQCELLARECQ